MPRHGARCSMNALCNAGSCLQRLHRRAAVFALQRATSTRRGDVPELPAIQVQLVVERLDAAAERARCATLVAAEVLQCRDDERALDVVERRADRQRDRQRIVTRRVTIARCRCARAGAAPKSASASSTSSHSTNARSTPLRSWRTLPGQSYLREAAAHRLGEPLARAVALVQFLQEDNRRARPTSSPRSRSGGNLIITTASR